MTSRHRPVVPGPGAATSRAGQVLLAVSALSTSAAGGAFLTWSTFTTAGLAQLPTAQGVAAMQEMNVAAPRSATFMLLIFAPAALGVAAAIGALVRRDPSFPLVVAAAAVYVIGAVGVTVFFHVPRNEALMGWDAVTTDGATWSGWLSAWVAGNHVRTASGLVSGALLAAALLRRRAG